MAWRVETTTPPATKRSGWQVEPVSPLEAQFGPSWFPGNQPEPTGPSPLLETFAKSWPGLEMALPYAEQIGQMTKQSAAPMIGGMTGEAIGRRVAGPLGAVGGEAIGSGLGEGFNQVAGITEPDAKQIAIQALSGPAVRGAAAGISKLAPQFHRVFPGAASAMNDVTVESVKATKPFHGLVGTPELPPAVQDVAERLTGSRTPSTDDLYDKVVSVFKPRIPTSNLAQTVAELTRKEVIETNLPNASAQRLLKKMSGAMEDWGSDMPFQVIRNDIKALRGMAKDLGKSGAAGASTLRGVVQQIEEALAKDLDAAAATAPGKAADLGVQSLRATNQLYKYEKTMERMDDLVGKAFSKPRAPDNLVRFRGNDLADALEKSKSLEFFRKNLNALDPGAIGEIKKLALKLNEVPIAPPPQGAMFGSGPEWAKVFSIAGLGTGLGTAVGGDIATSGTAAGVAAVGLVAVQSIISRAMMSKKGRRMLGDMLKQGGTLDWPKLSTLAQFLASQSAEPPTPQGPPMGVEVAR